MNSVIYIIIRIRMSGQVRYNPLSNPEIESKTMNSMMKLMIVLFQISSSAQLMDMDDL